MFAPFPITKLSLGVDNEVLLNYINKTLNGEIPDKYSQPEGRSVQKNKTNGEYFISLFGFNKLNITNISINFNTHFISLNYYDFPDIIYIPSILTTKSQLRVLETLTRTANCSFESKSLRDKKIEYLCQIRDISDISNVKLVPDNIFGDSRVNLKTSPLALKYIDNLENIPDDDSYNAVFNVENLYDLENATYNKIYQLSFNITGQIEEGNSTYLNKKDLKLNITKLSNKTDSADCIIYNQSLKDDYYLECQLDNSEGYDLDGSYSLIDDENLLFVKFATNQSSKITFNNTRYYHKSSINLSPGIIAVIVIVPIVVLAALISVILYFRKGRPIDVSKVNNTSNVGDNYNSSTKI